MSHVVEIPGKPTVVLVHGAFADGSSWNGVIERLQAKGIAVTAPANPLRGLSADSTYLESVLKQLSGPVVLVGHSYAGAVISNAAAHARNVVGLVFVAAFVTEEGEVLGQVTPTSKDSVLMPALVPHEFRTSGGEIGVEFVVDPAKFRDAFAADLPEETAALMAATQRPVADAAFSDPATVPGWKDRPSWAVIATGDRAAGADLTRSMAERAGAAITDVVGSHVIMVSQPQSVTDVIVQAVEATSAVGVA
jgi:pimeloyl-ACP methyl ester carboxylesterase